MNRKTIALVILVFILIFSSLLFYSHLKSEPRGFDAERAYQDIVYQVSLGPRIPGSTAHKNVQSWISNELRMSDWEVEKQDGERENFPIHNLIAKRGSGNTWIVLGAHYDTRIFADRDPNKLKQNEPVPGANDGGSGVAVLLELARCLPKYSDLTIWLVFFDAEDNGNINGYDWSLGARYFVAELVGKPDKVIILDMIGDKDLNIYMEKNSDLELTQSIWTEASQLGYHQFIQQPKHRIIDDHIPFIEAGITAVDIIDFDYPYWHTTQDTPDKVSAQSLQAIGDTLMAWLKNVEVGLKISWQKYQPCVNLSLMTAGILLSQIRNNWILEVSNQLVNEEQLRKDLQEQLTNFFDLLILAIDRNDPFVVDLILTDWVRTRTVTELENPEGSILPVLSQIQIITFDVVSKNLCPEDALTIIRPLTVIFTHGMEYASTEETRLHVQHITDELDQTRATLEKLEKSKSDFISVAAHELKTPLTLIEGYASMLKDTLTQECINENLANLYIKGVQCRHSTA